MSTIFASKRCMERRLRHWLMIHFAKIMRLTMYVDPSGCSYTDICTLRELTTALGGLEVMVLSLSRIAFLILKHINSHMLHPH